MIHFLFSLKRKLKKWLILRKNRFLRPKIRSENLKFMQQKIGLGGGCHWCTEAVFQQINGVTRVEQGYIASVAAENRLSEAIIVHFDPKIVSLKALIQIHLNTHKSQSDHSFRTKYRSAIYYFNEDDAAKCEKILATIQLTSQEPIITQILPFNYFEPSRESIQDYYKKNKNAPFCERYIKPKLLLLQENYADHLK